MTPENYNVGDKIIVTEEYLPYFNEGDEGTLTRKDRDGDWWVENHSHSHNGYSLWCIGHANGYTFEHKPKEDV